MKANFLFFKNGDLSKFLKNKKIELKNELESYNSNYILNVSEEDFCKYLVLKYSLNPPKIYEDEKYIYSSEEVEIDISKDPKRIISDRNKPFYIKGLQIIIAVPFEGDGELFHYIPSKFTYNPPRGVIVGNEIHLIYETDKNDKSAKEKLERQIQQELNEIKNYLVWIEQDVKVFNESLYQLVKKLFSQRKKKLLGDYGLVSSLGIPLKRRENLPETYTIPSIRKKTEFEPPNASIESYSPEPALSLNEYENILVMINNMALVMERSPQTFSKLKEEEIRDHFLMMLNAKYEGQATGETFNYGGKTDILIRYENKNVFIAECKFWRGEKKLIETINQLLGYTSWRDTKTAILLFSKNKNFNSVLEKIDRTVKSHVCFKRDWNLKSKKLNSETIFSYIFHQPKDANREIFLTIMTFNIPK